MNICLWLEVDMETLRYISLNKRYMFEIFIIKLEVYFWAPDFEGKSRFDESMPLMMAKAEDKMKDLLFVFTDDWDDRTDFVMKRKF